LILYAVFPGVRKPAISGGAEASYFRGVPKTCNITHNSGTEYWKRISENMQRDSSPQEKIGTPAAPKYGQWVQTERKAHEAWANLLTRKPRAGILLHLLVAHMGHQNAVVISQKTLAKLMNVTDRTVRTAVSDLVAERWIQVLKLNGPGSVSAYVVNDRVAWGQPRGELVLSVFSAAVVADKDDQDPATMDSTDLRRIPTLYPGEQQLPSGPHEDPPSQPCLPDMEPDLPFLEAQETDSQGKLEADGQGRLID
jgi:hypothetical protein